MIVFKYKINSLEHKEEFQTLGAALSNMFNLFDYCEICSELIVIDDKCIKYAIADINTSADMNVHDIESDELTEWEADGSLDEARIVKFKDKYFAIYKA